MAKKIITTPPPNLIGQPSVNLRKPDFEAVIYNKGYDVIIERAIACPCKSGDGHPNIDCQNCRGVGWVFINPTSTRCILTSINKSTKYKEWSTELIGTVSVTTYFSQRLSYMDRITMMNNPYVTNTSILSEIKRLRIVGTQTPFVFLSYKPMTVKEVYLYTAPDIPLLKLDPLTDFNINLDNPYILDLTYVFPVDFNGSISVTYEHELQYHVIDIPHDVRNSFKVNNDGRDEQITLPINAIARKAFNVLDVSDYGGLNLIDNSYL